MSRLLASALLTGFVLVGCSAGPRSATPTAPTADPLAQFPTDAQGATRPGLAQVMNVQQRYGDALLELLGVVGDGVGMDESGRPVIQVFVTRSGLRVPRSIQGVPVEQEVAPEFSAFSLTDRYRQLPIGVSAGSAQECFPGTLGAVLLQGNRDLALSCNHVFARQNQATIGESVVQPSLPDASPACSLDPANVIGTLVDFEPLDFSGGDNTIDAAVAELSVPPGMVSGATPAGFYGFPGTVPAEPALGLAIQKVGRTTELTRGSVKSINVKIKVTYPLGVAKFQGVMLTSHAFGAFGDSGSLVVTDDGARAPVGLVFAGDAQGRALVCPIGPILTRFQATLLGS